MQVLSGIVHNASASQELVPLTMRQMQATGVYRARYAARAAFEAAHAENTSLEEQRCAQRAMT